MADVKIAAAYIRVSTDDQLEYSPDAQLAEIRRYAVSGGYILPDEYIFIDEGISGRGTAKRDSFNLMIGKAKLKPKPFDAILLWKFSRFARNREDSIVYKSMLRKQLGIEVISITEPVGDDKMSILIEALIEAMDEYYSINLAEEVKRGMTEKARRGGLQTNPSYGYHIDKSVNMLVPDSEEAEVIREIFARFIEGGTLLGIAKSLNARGLRTHRGNKFEGRTIEYILRNPVYIGMLRWNPAGRTKRGHWDNTDIILSRGAHQPIVDTDTWNRAQERISRMKVKYRPKARDPELMSHWMIGLIRCSSCGGTLIYSQRTWFKCCNYTKGKCDISQHVNAQWLEAALIDKLKYDSEHPFALSYTTYKQDASESRDMQSIKNAISLIEKKKERLREAFLAGIDSIDDYKRIRAELDAEQTTLERTLHQMSVPADPAQTQMQLTAGIKSALSVITDPTATNITKHDAATDVIENCTWDKASGVLLINYRLYI